ncbi:hypothetical protein [Desulfoluna spongiiphila]|uniref:hypothetical protein n=1 Tax=Desulfoluna spongiiphila TaxID=419481 RepID=UPI000B878F64|nr:hypothetical protein [Desulfoluna spongiiphila]
MIARRGNGEKQKQGVGAGPTHLDLASGGPAGSQTFEKFDKQVLSAILTHSNVIVFRLILLRVYACAFMAQPPGAEQKSAGNRKVFAALFSKSDPPEAAKLKMPPAALPGAKLLPDLITTGLIDRFGLV